MGSIIDTSVNAAKSIFKAFRKLKQTGTYKRVNPVTTYDPAIGVTESTEDKPFTSLIMLDYKRDEREKSPEIKNGDKKGFIEAVDIKSIDTVENPFSDRDYLVLASGVRWDVVSVKRVPADLAVSAYIFQLRSSEV